MLSVLVLLLACCCKVVWPSPVLTVPIRIFTFQADERLILGWFKYHAQLIGSPERIYIIDHNSQDPVVLQHLSEIRQLGGVVVPYDGPFSAKSASMTQLMRNVTHGAEFLVPLDADEYIGVNSPPAGISFDRRLILDEFKRMPPAAGR